MNAPAPLPALTMNDAARYWGRLGAGTLPFCSTTKAGAALLDAHPEWTVLTPAARARILCALAVDAYATFEAWMSQRPKEWHLLTCVHRCECDTEPRPILSDMELWCATVGDVLLGLRHAGYHSEARSFGSGLPAEGEDRERDLRRTLDRMRHMVKRRPAVDQCTALVVFSRPLTERIAA